MKPLVLILISALVASCASPEPKPPKKEVQGVNDGEPTLEEIRIAAIEKVVNETQALRHQCWEEAAAQTIRFSGTVVLRFVFAEPGDVAEVQVVSDKTQSKTLTTCLQRAYKKHPWPPVFDKSTPVELPFTFKQVNAQYVVHRDAVDPTHKADTMRLLHGANTLNPDVELKVLSEPGAHVLETDVIVVPVRGKAYLVPEKCKHVSYGRKKKCKDLKLFRAALVPSGRHFYTQPEPPATRTSILVLKLTAATGQRAAILDNPTSYDIGGGAGKAEFLIDSVATKAPAFVGILSGGATFRAPQHAHEHSHEILYILDGGGTMTVNSERYEVRAGHGIQIPAGAKHSFTAGQNGIKAIQFYLEGGPEQRFKK